MQAYAIKKTRCVGSMCISSRARTGRDRQREEMIGLAYSRGLRTDSMGFPIRKRHLYAPVVELFLRNAQPYTLSGFKAATLNNNNI